MIVESYAPVVQQDRNAAPAGQDQVEDGDRNDNLQDADTLADLADPPMDAMSRKREDTDMDNLPDGDRQLTTDSDAVDTGLNDSDLGADAAGLGPDTMPTGGEDRTGDRATGLGTGVRE